MNTLKIKKILLITAIISSILSCTMFFIIKLENSMYIMYYPFELVGKIIRSLSLSSSIGNIVSWIIYIGICMIPTFIYFYKYKKVDFILLISSIYLLFAVYNFINPEGFYKLLPDELQSATEFITAVKLSIAMMFYIILISYFVLFSMRYLSEGQSALKGLQIILTVFLGAYLVAIFYFGLFDILKNSSLLYLVKYILLLAPNIMSMIVIFTGIELVNNFAENQYSETVVEDIRKIHKYSKSTVYLSILSSLIANGMQIFLFSTMYDIEMFLDIPFIPLIVAFVGMILCKYFKENNNLFDDNNSII